MNIAEILKLKYPGADFRRDVLLQNDGEGPYIKEWNLANISQPTQEELDKWAVELDLPYRQQQARLQRVYPDIKAQLDMQYWDAINGTTVWQDTIAAIKEASPIPQE